MVPPTVLVQRPQLTQPLPGPPDLLVGHLAEFRLEALPVDGSAALLDDDPGLFTRLDALVELVEKGSHGVPESVPPVQRTHTQICAPGLQAVLMSPPWARESGVGCLSSPSMWMMWTWWSRRSRIAVVRISSPAKISGPSRTCLFHVRMMEPFS